jgi:4-hydroxybutyrate dehydrogenase
MDALTHCIETYLSPLVNPPAEAIALDGVERAARWIEEATSNGRSRAARWNMMMASVEGALTFQKGLGAVHAMAHPLGALEGLPLHHHSERGAAAGGAPVQRARGAREVRAPAPGHRPRGERRSGRMGRRSQRQARAARRARPLGVSSEVLPRIAQHAEQDPSTETNARPATRVDYEEMLHASLGE